MSFFRRSIAWAIFLGFSTVVGGGVFHFVRYRPRCVIEARHENLSVQHLSHDGSRLVAHRRPVDRIDQPKTPGEHAYQPRLEVIDTRTGCAVWTVENFAKFSPTGAVYVHRSKDGRYLAGMGHGTIVLADCQNEQTQIVEIPRVLSMTVDGVETKVEHSGVLPNTTCRFSPEGRWLVVQAGVDVVVDVAEGRIKRAFPAFWLIKSDRFVLYGPHGKLRLWDLDGECLHWLEPTQIKYASALASKDGRWLLLSGRGERRGYPAEREELICQQAEVWDLTDKQRRFHLGGEDGKRWHVMIGPQSSCLAVWTEDEQDYAFSWIDLAADEDRIGLALRNPARIRRYPFKSGQPSEKGFFSPNGKLFTFRQQPVPNELPIYTVFDTVTHRALWQTSQYFLVDFSFDGESALCLGQSFETAFVDRRDARTGAYQNKSLWSDEPSHYSSDGKLIVSYQVASKLAEGPFWDWLVEYLPKWCQLPGASFTHVLVVAETETGRERLRVAVEDVSEVRLSGDGGTVLAHYADIDDQGNLTGTRVRIWDVHPLQAWIWGVTAALATGILLLLLRKWRMRTRASSRRPANPASVEA